MDAIVETAADHEEFLNRDLQEEQQDYSVGGSPDMQRGSHPASSPAEEGRREV